ncbi:hypothetical protein K523DRAFT_137855 [Schizophyllum commune Tattone D]|nr:hypothetical protein K523DRAFT_137855 [Schizophyllum commune Tattone D]
MYPVAHQGGQFRRVYRPCNASTKKKKSTSNLTTIVHSNIEGTHSVHKSIMLVHQNRMRCYEYYTIYISRNWTSVHLTTSSVVRLTNSKYVIACPRHQSLSPPRDQPVHAY